MCLSICSDEHVQSPTLVKKGLLFSQVFIAVRYPREVCRGALPRLRGRGEQGDTVTFYPGHAGLYYPAIEAEIGILVRTSTRLWSADNRGSFVIRRPVHHGVASEAALRGSLRDGNNR